MNWQELISDFLMLVFLTALISHWASEIRDSIRHWRHKE